MELACETREKLFKQSSSSKAACHEGSDTTRAMADLSLPATRENPVLLSDVN
jgi:hypothetical protein